MSVPARGEALAGVACAGDRLADALVARREALIAAVSEIATYDSAVEELECAVRALRGAESELDRHAPSARAVAVFLPSNNLLYSYALFGLIPAMYSDEVWIRPAARYAHVAVGLHAELAEAVADLLPGRVDLQPCSQREFVARCGGAEAVAFAGQHANGVRMASTVSPETKVLLFGSGPNPMVIGPEARLAEAVPAALRARLYNVGQDCLCSDVYFVHASLAGAFLGAVCDALASLPAGDRRSPGTVLAPLVYPDGAAWAERFVHQHRDLVVWTGRPSDPAGPGPVVLAAPASLDLHPPELFSPVFLVVTYEDVREVRAWLDSPQERARGMYLSVFGEPGLLGPAVQATSVVCAEQTTFDFEDGNTPFGGYGAEASSVSHRGTLSARPLLLSAELARGRS
jgi:acyl-CoA reductase-like NAD-dependent aldehyde dehydrogenase